MAFSVAGADGQRTQGYLGWRYRIVCFTASMSSGSYCLLRHGRYFLVLQRCAINPACAPTAKSLRSSLEGGITFRMRQLSRRFQRVDFRSWRRPLSNDFLQEQLISISIYTNVNNSCRHVIQHNYECNHLSVSTEADGSQAVLTMRCTDTTGDSGQCSIICAAVGAR